MTIQYLVPPVRVMGSPVGVLTETLCQAGFAEFDSQPYPRESAMGAGVACGPPLSGTMCNIIAGGLLNAE